MDLISVIVPVYNVEQYLMRCVNSILEQTYQNIEIILVDDGSPDRCPEICEEIKKQDSRVKVIHKENGGLGFARNSGLDAASGDYVTFIDSDDWISVDHIENLCREAKKTKADVVIGSHTRVFLDGTIQESPISLQQKLYEASDIPKAIVLPLIGADVKDIQDVQLQASSCMNLYRLEVINRYGIRFPSEKVAISEDLFFNVDVFSHVERISVMDETGYFYFQNLSSISRKYDVGRLDRTVCFYEKMKHLLRKYGLEDMAGFRLERTFLMDIRVLLRMIVLSDMPKKEKYQEIQKTLENELVKNVLACYPVDSFIPMMRLLVKQMRKGNVRGVYCLIKIRESARGSMLVKDFLKRVGIGR